MLLSPSLLLSIAKLQDTLSLLVTLAREPVLPSPHHPLVSPCDCDISIIDGARPWHYHGRLCLSGFHDGLRSAGNWRNYQLWWWKRQFLLKKAYAFFEYYLFGAKQLLKIHAHFLCGPVMWHSQKSPRILKMQTHCLFSLSKEFPSHISNKTKGDGVGGLYSLQIICMRALFLFATWEGRWNGFSECGEVRSPLGLHN